MVLLSLSQVFSNFIKEEATLIASLFILNSEDLVEKLKSLNINYNSKLVSFDEKSLFTNVPVDKVLSFLPEILGNEVNGIPSPNIIELIKLCVEGTGFTFEGSYYKQAFGMSMGCPLSPVLANLYMEYFETRLLSKIKASNIKWFRYVDDILCFWPCDLDVHNFLLRLNLLEETIQFTVEEENTNNSIPFLDVEIVRSDLNLTTKVYRKPTNICSYVHFYSNHHTNVKKSVFISMFLRAFKICSKEYLDDEIINIKNIAKKLQYPSEIIENCLYIAKSKFQHSNINNNNNSISNISNNNNNNNNSNDSNDNNNDDNNRTNHNDNNNNNNNNNIEMRTDASRDVSVSKTIVLPYNENFLDVCKPLKLLGVKVAFSYFTIKDQLISHAPKNDSGGVYEIKCNGCESRYIGETGKTLDKRIQQHKYSVKSGQNNNAIFNHFANMNHKICWENSKFIFKSKNYIERNIVESTVIANTFNENMNLSYGQIKTDLFINQMVRNFISYPP